MFDFKLTGSGSINKEYQNFNSKVHRATQAGVRAFASELTPCLQRHIQKDVYSAYTPEDYERRYDHPQYGRSIYSEENIDYRFFPNGRGVEFTYEPNGRNTNYPTSAYYLDGDSIISAIQQDKGYLWFNDGSIGVKRPFWDNFLQEVETQGEGWFVNGFNGYDGQLQAKQDGSMKIESSDYELRPTGEVKIS